MITMDDIIREGHPTLRKVAEEIELPLSDEFKKLGEDMMTFLKNSQDPELSEKYNLRGGVGLAAPQLDISKRITAVHIPDDTVEDETSVAPLFSDVLINPKIISHSVKQICLPGGEGCLSVDREVRGYVPRAKRITLQYTDLDGKEQVVRLKGYPAIVIQHELDHLNGIMFYDHINGEKPYDLDEKTSVLDDWD